MTQGNEARRSTASLATRLGLGAICALTLGLLIWGIAQQTGYAVLPRAVEDLDFGPQTLGGFEARTTAELEYLVGKQRPGDVISLDPPGSVMLVPEISGTLLVLTLLEALAFWLVCAFALAPRIAKPGVGDLFGSLLLGAVVVGIGGTSYPHTPGIRFLSCLWLAAMAFMGPLFVRFSRVFPRPVPSRWGRSRPHLLLLLLGAGIALWNVVAWLGATAAPGATGIAGTTVPRFALYGLAVLCLFAACWNLYRCSRTARLDRERRQAKWILLGIAIGLTPYFVLRALPRALPWVGASWPPWGPEVDRVFEMLVPLTFGIAVARERFLDIDVIIRRGILYTLLALGAAAVFFGTALLLATVVAAGLGLPDAQARWAYAVAGVITGLLFLPAKRGIGRLVDRTFFRLRHAHDEALAALDRDLASAGGQSEVATRLCTFLDGVLQPKASGAVVESGDGWARCGAFEDTAPEAFAAVDTLVARPDATGTPEVERNGFPEAAATEDVRLVQPIRADGRTLGVLLVGEKRTERHYLPEDLAVLAAAAEKAGIHLERLALVQQVAEEAMAHRTLAEVSRQKAEFFARLAHDLRTPITAVRWSVENLLDGLPGPLTDRQTQYLEGVGAAGGQLARLVDNLVDLGRLDLAAPQRPDEAVDLAAVVGEAMAALAVIASERRATLEVHTGEGLPPIRGRKEAAFQIVINLVDNALKYTAPDTAVDVTLASDADGIVLTVRDHGPGLPEDAEDLFELFRQGPESPHVQAKGFGIGLHIVRTWTETLGGEITADNHPDGGARFTCRLRRWEDEEATG